MARLGKEKGGSSLISAPKILGKATEKRHSSKKSGRGKRDSEDAVLKKQVLALGGDQNDYDLVKNVDDASESGPYNHDVSCHLCFYVSKYLTSTI